MKNPFPGTAAKGRGSTSRGRQLEPSTGKAGCQANSGAISYRQEKILQIPLSISCRQEFHCLELPKPSREDHRFSGARLSPGRRHTVTLSRPRERRAARRKPGRLLRAPHQKCIRVIDHSHRRISPRQSRLSPDSHPSPAPTQSTQVLEHGDPMMRWHTLIPSP